MEREPEQTLAELTAEAEKLGLYDDPATRPCGMVVGYNRELSVGDNDYYIHCGVTPTQPLGAEPYDWPMCADHMAVWAASKADLTIRNAMAMAWTGTPYGIGTENSVDAVMEAVFSLGFVIGPDLSGEVERLRGWLSAIFDDVAGGLRQWMAGQALDGKPAPKS